MADEKKQKFVRTTTPKGRASYPWLNRPDTKFDADGVYKCNLVVPKKDAKKLIALIDAEAKKALVAAGEANPKLKKTIKAGELPYYAETDDEGEETGNIVFKTKQRARITTKKGEVIEKTIPLFDASGAKVKANVGGGSVLKLNIELAHYYMAAQKSAGVTLRLQAAQIIDLVEFGSGGSAESYGFGSEDGYVGSASADDDDDDNTSNINKDADDSEDSSESEGEDDIF